MPNPPRKHHFIPIFYTRKWAGADGRVVRFTKPRTVVDRRVHPSQVGWQLDLYRIPGEEYEHSQMLEEKFFRDLDNIAASALSKMTLSPMVPLNGTEAWAWSTFIMSLLHRTPEYLTSTKEASRRLWLKTLPRLRDSYGVIRGDGDPETFDEYVRSRDDIETERSLLRGLPELISNPRISQFISEMNWLAIDVPDDQPDLLLSDNPLARSNGIKMPGGHIALPLSPRRLMVATWERRLAVQLESLPVSQLISRMNKWTVESAQHFVVARDTTKKGYIRRHFGNNPKQALNDAVGRTAETE